HHPADRPGPRRFVPARDPCRRRRVGRTHAAPAGGLAARRRGSLGQGDRCPPAHLAPHRRVPQGPPHGSPGLADHRRTLSVRLPGWVDQPGLISIFPSFYYLFSAPGCAASATAWFREVLLRRSSLVTSGGTHVKP